MDFDQIEARLTGGETLDDLADEFRAELISDGKMQDKDLASLTNKKVCAMAVRRYAQFKKVIDELKNRGILS